MRETNREEETALSETVLHEERWQKIKFDNTIRVWIAVPTYLASLVLWVQHVIPSVIPMSLIFTIYGAIQLFTNWMFMGSRFGRKFDFIFASFDTIAMSWSIFYTGGTESPLYFLYFIPLVVHAFHRDFSLVIFSGFGGVVLYAAAILSSIASPSTAMLTNLGARLFFMLLTVSVACLAINMLRKREEADQRRILRLKNLTLVSRELHHAVSLDNLSQVTVTLIRFINAGLGDHVKAQTCFLLDGAKRGDECQVENFSFASQLRVPVSGTENESFGVLFAGSHLPDAFKEEEVQFLEFVARSLGLSVQRLHRMEELRKSVEMNSCVMASTIASARSSDETFASVLDGVGTILTVEKAALMLWDSQHAVLKTVKTKGSCSTPERELALHLGQGGPGKALESGDLVCVSGDSENLFGGAETYGVKSLLAVPLKTMKGAPLGVITAARTEATEGFSTTEIQVVATFAARAALAVENALLHQSERSQIQHSDQPEIKKAA